VTEAYQLFSVLVIEHELAFSNTPMISLLSGKKTMRWEVEMRVGTVKVTVKL